MYRTTLRIVCGISLMVLLSAGSAMAQTWSSWQTLVDGGSDLLQYRTMVVVDTNMVDGYRVDFEINSQYSAPVTFQATFNVPILNPVDMTVDDYDEDYNYHLSGNTTVEGYIDADSINSLTISNLAIHVSDPDPETEEVVHTQTEQESGEEEVEEP